MVRTPGFHPGNEISIISKSTNLYYVEKVMQDIQEIKKMQPPFNKKEKQLINYLFSEYWYSSINKDNNLSIDTTKMNETKKYFYLLGMVSVSHW